MFLALLKEGMINPLGKILVKEGEFLMRCRWENRIFPMLGKEGLKSKTKGKTFLDCFAPGTSRFFLEIDLAFSNCCLTWEGL